MKLSKPLKMAHKLKDKVMHPLSIEKTNVKLADAAFLLYLLVFAAWVKEWNGQTKLSLTQQTTTAVHQTCTALVEPESTC